MTCDEWRAFLQDYVDGGLSEPAKVMIDRHLSECAPCFDDARAHRGVQNWLSSRPELEPPASLVDRVMESTRRPVGGWRRELIRIAAAAMFVAGLAAGTLAFVPLERIEKPSVGLPKPDVGPLLRIAGW